jgi:DNA mismatch endonuclease (patch repair protein)
LADIFSNEKRSEIMSKISGKETKPEILVRKFLFSKGFRYRKNQKSLPGSPDIVLKKYNTIIFIQGCFWHGHKNCKKASMPSTNKEFWEVKIHKNIERDKRVNEELRKSKWKVITVWECKINNKKSFEKTMNKIVAKLN